MWKGAPLNQSPFGQFQPVAGAVQRDGRLRVGFVLARSFTLSAFALFVDTLRLASDELDRSRRLHADWQVIGSTRHLIQSSCGVSVAPTSDFLDPRLFDYLVVVGGLLTVETPVDEQTLRYLKQAAARQVPLIGACTGTFILATAGLLKNHRACISWLHYKAYRERFPDHPVHSDRLFSFEQDRGSCVGGTSAADMAAFLVRQHINRGAERNALEVLQIGQARTPSDLQPRQPLAGDLEGAGEKVDARIRSVLLHMEQYMDEALSIATLAAKVRISRRQLERLFFSELGMTPAEAYSKIRMKKAKTLLLNSDAALIDIALEVGLQSSQHLARMFRRIYGITPSQLRSAPTRLP